MTKMQKKIYLPQNLVFLRRQKSAQSMLDRLLLKTGHFISYANYINHERGHSRPKYEDLKAYRDYYELYSMEEMLFVDLESLQKDIEQIHQATNELVLKLGGGA